MNALQRHLSKAGKVKTAKKSAAAKANGAKGGRPHDIDKLLRAWSHWPELETALETLGKGGDLDANEAAMEIVITAEHEFDLDYAPDMQTLCDRHDTTREAGMRRNRPLEVEDILRMPSCHRAIFGEHVFVRSSALKKLVEKNS